MAMAACLLDWRGSKWPYRLALDALGIRDADGVDVFLQERKICIDGKFGRLLFLDADGFDEFE